MLCQDPCLEYHFGGYGLHSHIFARFAVQWELYGQRRLLFSTGRSIVPAGASNEDTPEVMAMKAELVALRALKATTTPAATTGAGKRACAQQDRLPKLRASGELHDPSATSNSGETVRELSVSARATQEPARAKQEPQESCKSQARAKQEPYKRYQQERCKSKQEQCKSHARAMQEPVTSASDASDICKRCL